MIIPHRAALLWLLAALLLVSTTFAQTDAQQRLGPFTTSPRSVRSRDVDQRHVRLDLRFDFDKQQIAGRALLTLAPFKPLSSIELDAADMKINRVAIVGDESNQAERELKYQTRAQTLTITLDREYPGGESLKLAIDYLIVKPKYGAHFVEPDDSEPDQPRMVWTQGEPEYAHYWFPCIDSPTDRLTSEIVATVPKEYVVLSNGSLFNKRDNNDGTRTWHWAQIQSHVPYLMSIVAGDFEAYEQSWDGIPIVSYVPKGRLADAARSFEKTPAMMKFFSEKIGYRYPWPKYAQICVDEYSWGGMEHTSATTLNVRTLHDARAHLDVDSDNLVAHELVHQWWGDLLTCKDWGELWLNESFATYFATLWEEHDAGWDEAAWTRHQEAEEYLGEDQRYRRPIVSYRYNSPNNMFDRHSYPKGGRVLHMLRFELGDELFWKVMSHYCQANEFRTVETADLRRSIEDVTGRGLNWFFDQWVHRGGHPDFQVDWRWDEQASAVRLTVKQTQKVDDITPLFRTDVEVELVTTGDAITRRVTVSKAEETFVFPLSTRPARVCFDPRDWILKKLTFDKSKEELLDQLQHDTHLMCRVQAAQDLAKFSKDEDVAAVLIGAARNDSFWAVRQEAVKVLAKLNGDKVRRALIEAARKDTKSFVRREAIKALANFSHDDSRATLRHVIGHDPSYYAIADALRTLLKVDRQNCAADFLAALDCDSHQEVILKAVCDGLVELKEQNAAERLSAMLDGKITPERRVVLLGGLARLKSDDAQVVEALRKLLDNDREHVQTAAIAALVAIGDRDTADVLLERRKKEDDADVLLAIDEAVEKIHAKQRDADQLRKEIELLRKQNRDLEQRLKKLENAAAQ
jgi:aminopeptidase N